MRLIKTTLLPTGVQEVTVEFDYLIFKKVKTYRKYPDGKILEYKSPDKYWILGGFQYHDVNQIFSIIVEPTNN